MLKRGFARGVLHDARSATELAHARPAYAAGIRAAIATVTPLILARHLPPGTASWASLAGLNVALSDRGGPYRTRAKTMSALAAATAFGVLLGSLLAGHLAAAVLVTLAFATVCALSRGWTEVGPIFGIAPLTSFAIALALPVDASAAAWMRAAAILAGGAWAMVLAIVLWPVFPYRPVRLRIAECYRAIARYMEVVVSDHAAGEKEDPWKLRPYVVAVRTAIEAARGALAVSRRGRGSESSRGERLLVLHEIADQIFVHLIALIEASDALRSSRSSEGRDALEAALGGMAQTTRGLASAIESEVDLPRIPITWNGAPLRAVDGSLGEIVDRMADYAATATALAASLNSGDPVPPDGEAIGVADSRPEPVLFPLAIVVRPSSVVLRHALRVAIVTTSAVLITGLLHLNRGYWVTLTVVVILQPYAATTRQKGLQRVIGTMIGGIVAAVLSAYFHNAAAVMTLVALFTMLCVALLPLNYGAYAVLGTPAFVLLAEASASDWHLARLRVVNTLIGGALALGGAQLLWPGDERNHLPELIAAALRANAEFLRRALALVGGAGDTDLGALRDVRRAIAEAALNAEDSFQRLLSEHQGTVETLEPVMTLLVYTRRLAASIAALAVSSTGASHTASEMLPPFEAAAVGVLIDLADAVAGGAAPAPYPPAGSIVFPDALTAPLLHQRLTRVARQLKLMHGAVERLTVTR